MKITTTQLRKIVREEIKKAYSIKEDELVKNKKTGAVYTVKKLDPAIHVKADQKPNNQTTPQPKKTSTWGSIKGLAKDIWNSIPAAKYPTNFNEK